MSETIVRCPYFEINLMVTIALDTIGHFSKTELNLTHFHTNPNFLLALWKDLAELLQKQTEVLKKSIFGELMRERNNISLPYNMVRCTYIWRHYKTYVHGIICVGFYVDPWYWKYIRSHARRQAPRPRGGRKIWSSLKGPHFWLWSLIFSKSEASP